MEFSSHDELIKMAENEYGMIYNSVFTKDVTGGGLSNIDSINEAYYINKAAMSGKVENSDRLSEFFNQQKQQYDKYMAASTEEEKLALLDTIIYDSYIKTIAALETSDKCRRAAIERINDTKELVTILLQEKNQDIRLCIFENIKKDLPCKDFRAIYTSENCKELQKKIREECQGNAMDYLIIIDGDLENQLKYVESTEDKYVLGSIASTTFDMRLRIAASKKITDAVVIYDIIDSLELNTEDELYMILLKKLDSRYNLAVKFILENEEKYEKQCECMVYYVNNKDALDEIAEKAKSLYIRLLARLILKGKIKEAKYQAED